MITIIIILIITAVIFFVVKKWKSNEEFYDGLKEREVQLEKEILEHDKVISMFDKLNSGVQEIRHEGVVEYLSYLHKQLELEKKGEVNDFSKENPEEALSTIKNLIDELEHENDLYNKLEEVSSSPEFKVKWELIDKKLESEDEQEVNEGRRELTELAKETLKMEKNGIKSGASKSILKFMHENFPELDK